MARSFRGEVGGGGGCDREEVGIIVCSVAALRRSLTTEFNTLMMMMMMKQMMTICVCVCIVRVSVSLGG